MLNVLTQSKSRRFAAGAICFITGIIFATALGLGRAVLPYLLAIFFLWLTALILCWQREEVRAILLISFWLFFGFGRAVFSEPALTSDWVRFYNGRLVEFEGIVSRAESDSERLKLIINVKNLKHLLAQYPKAAPVKGKILVFTGALSRFNYGDKLKISCALEESKFSKQLAANGVWSVCYRPSAVKFLKDRQGNYLMHQLFSLRQFFLNLSDKILPEPASSLLSGLLLGARGDFSPDLKQAFNRTGLSHIVAVSGYNVTIIAAALLALGRGLTLPRRRSFWLVTLGLAVFIILSGGSAATVRAGILGWLLLLANYLGRANINQISRLMLITAALMLFFNPYHLYDLGWQLSFLAVLGLIYLAPLYTRLLPLTREIWGLKEVLTSTLGAITATAPLIVYQFGQFSLIAPLVNLLILPIIPLTMFLSALSLTIAAAWLPFGQAVAFLPWLLLNYIARTASFFSSLGFAAFALPTLPRWSIAAIYLVIILAVIRYEKS